MGNKIASRLPHLALGVVCLVSLAARSAWIGLPCHGRCQTSSQHVLIFDERYYVNAARVIAGIRPAAVGGVAYRHAPLGSDPNAEHPQLAKLIMAGSIELLGDGPWAWRLGSLLFGTLAILGMYALVRGAGGGPWLGVGAAALMAADNLMLVTDRIGTLEAYVVAAMVWAVALYIRGRPLLGGVVAGIGVAMKLFGFDVILVLALWELLAWRAAKVDPDDRSAAPRASAAGTWRRLGRCRSARLAAATAVMAGTFIALLAVMDRVARPFDNAARQFVGGGPFGHLAHMISYAAHQTGEGAAGGIASYPWEWLVDLKPIAYLTINPHAPGGLVGDHPQVHFLGLISPPILLAGLVGMALALWAAVRRGGSRSAVAGPGLSLGPTSAADRRLLNLAAAWFVGTFGPFLIAGGVFGRTTYLYYMTIVMPGMYVAAVWLVQRLRRYRWLVGIWVAAVAVAAIVLYPLTPLPGM